MRNFLLLCWLLPGFVFAQTADGQLIGVRADGRGITKTYSYQYGKADKLLVDQVLPIVAQYGTDRQRRRARRLQRFGTVNGAMAGLGVLGFASTGFFGEPQLQTRQTIGLTGLGLFTIGMLASFVQDRQAKRLVRAYNDTLLAQMPYVPTYADLPYLTLADTVAITGKTYSYRGMEGVLPTRTPGFDQRSLNPRPNLVGRIGNGLVYIGLLAVGITARFALGQGDYRRFAWAGAGITTAGFAVSLGGHGKWEQRRQFDAIERYNRMVRERGHPN